MGYQILICLLSLVLFVHGDKPNIVLVVLDDVGWADIGYNSRFFSSSESLPTPQMDELAEKGVKFSSYYVHPTCTPTRAALMTGMYSANTGLTIAAMPGSTVGLPLHLPTMPQLLRKEGYECHMVGKWHLGNAQWTQTPVGRGFQSFVGSLLSQFDSYSKQMVKPDGSPIAVDWMSAYENRTYSHFLDPRHATLAISQGSQEVINRHSPALGPLFLYVAFTAAHAPLQPMPEHEAKCTHFIHPWRRGMCGMVAGLDDGVSNISQHIETHLGSNSVLVVTSDNGGAPWFGGLNEPLRGGKTSPFEGGVRVPAFAVDFTSAHSSDMPGLYLGTSKRWFRGLVHVTDWLPTFIGWAHKANNNSPITIDGIDMGKAFLKQISEVDVASPRQEMILDMYYSGEAIWSEESVVAIRSGKWKLISGVARDPLWYSHPSTYLNTSEGSYPVLVGELLIRYLEPVTGVSSFDTLRALIIWTWVHSYYLFDKTLLFDIEADPSERIDLSQKYPEIVTSLLRRAEIVKARRPRQYEYWMVVPDFQKTLVSGTCKDTISSSSSFCRFAHPWIGDSEDPTSVPLIHTKDLAARIIKQMLKDFFSKLVCGGFIVIMLTSLSMRFLR